MHGVIGTIISNFSGDVVCRLGLWRLSWLSSSLGAPDRFCTTAANFCYVALFATVETVALLESASVRSVVRSTATVAWVALLVEFLSRPLPVRLRANGMNSLAFFQLLRTFIGGFQCLHQRECPVVCQRGLREQSALQLPVIYATD